MHQQGVALGVVVQEFLLAQPVEQVVAIRGVEDFLQGVAFFQALAVVRHGQQVQIVIAQHAGQGIAHGVEKTQGFQRLRATVDQVADQPQTILGGVEGHFLKQALQRLQAALQVADGVDGHISAALPGPPGGRGRWARRRWHRHRSASGSCLA